MTEESVFIAEGTWIATVITRVRKNSPPFSDAHSLDRVAPERVFTPFRAIIGLIWESSASAFCVCREKSVARIASKEVCGPGRRMLKELPLRGFPRKTPFRAEDPGMSV